ncbi:MAG TPA: capsule assembly Wzi family protein [Puia sp.]
MKFCFTLLLGFIVIGSTAQTGTMNGSLEVQGIATSPHNTPFWFRSNQFGSVPLPGTSASFIGTVHVDYDSPRTSLIDWGGSLEVRGDMGEKARATLIEGYGKVRIGVFELKAGRIKEIMGLVDTSLSSGALAISGNALGIPKIELSIPDYYQLPWFGDLLAFKGSFAQGWVGEFANQYGHLTRHANTYFHQSSLYVRLGRPEWALKLYGGFNHQVMWGDEAEVFGPAYNLAGWKTYLYAIVGKTWHDSKVGNHLGSIDLGLDYDWEYTRLSAYHQFFYDEGGLYHLANISDGLSGISLTNKYDEERVFHWSKFLFEFLYTKNQGGYPDSRYSPSGDENYYNNYEYTQGWSYKGIGLGNPFLSTRNSIRPGLPNDSSDYFANNRVVAFNIGAQGAINKWYFKVKLSYSMNYGTFGTSIYGHSTGRLRVPPKYGIWKEVSQFSSYLEINKDLGGGYRLGCLGALDQGQLLNNSGGVILKLSKSFSR